MGSESDITTALATSALSGLQSYENQVLRGYKWLCNNKGPNNGWSWRRGSWDFPEPTAMALLALAMNDYCRPGMFTEIADFLRSRRCRDGGWNAGSPIMLGVHQPSSVHVTSMVIVAVLKTSIQLRADIPADLLSHAERYLCTQLTLSPYSLAWKIWALTALSEMKSCRPEGLAKCVKELPNLLDNSTIWNRNIHWVSIASISLSEYKRLLER